MTTTAEAVAISQQNAATDAVNKNAPRWTYERIEFEDDLRTNLPAFEDDAMAALTDAIDWAGDYAVELGRKFVDSDIENETSLAYAAVAYLLKYEGTFEYMVSMDADWKKWDSLSIGKLRGILNVLRAEFNRKPENTPFTENLSSIVEKMNASGHKNPKVRFMSGDEKVVISRASQGGRNAGSFYVKIDAGWDGEYFGKISATGDADQRLNDSRAMPALVTLNADPVAGMVAYGRVTGSCGVCGRTLTVKASVERGIGPICAGKYEG